MKLTKSKLKEMIKEELMNEASYSAKEVKNIIWDIRDYVDKLDHIVFNSNWNFEKYQYQFKIPESKSTVIRNAVENIDLHEKPKDKINLIYHTTPWRGLAQLLNVFENLNLEKVELNVCS